MFEFHGWACIRHHAHDTDLALQDACVRECEARLEGLDIDHLARIQRYNGVDSLVISGRHNHRQSYVIELFQWIADHAPGSYGLLYVHDDEDARGGSHSLEFRVWRLARGALEARPDPFLSPVTPTLEDPYDSTRGD